MENKTLVKIHLSHRDTGLPAAGYVVNLFEIDDDYNKENEGKVTDENGDITPFHLDLNNYIYADIFVRDPDDNVVITAKNQYALRLPETIINIEV